MDNNELNSTKEGIIFSFIESVENTKAYYVRYDVLLKKFAQDAGSEADIDLSVVSDAEKDEFNKTILSLNYYMRQSKFYYKALAIKKNEKRDDIKETVDIIDKSLKEFMPNREQVEHAIDKLTLFIVENFTDVLSNNAKKVGMVI